MLLSFILREDVIEFTRRPYSDYYGNSYTSTASSRNSHVPEALLVRQKADASERVRVTFVSTMRRHDRIPQRPGWRRTKATSTSNESGLISIVLFDRDIVVS